jgi:hypothetical protein
MSVEYKVGSFKEFEEHLKGLLKKKEERIKKAALKTVEFAVIQIKENAPVALGDVLKSVHAEDNVAVVDAPHAAALETGSRPHTPPLQPLIEWAKQQPEIAFGMSPEQLARFVQQAIKVKGTKPTFFVGNQISKIGLEYLRLIQEALSTPE